MRAERPPVTVDDIGATLEGGDYDGGETATRWKKGRTLIVRYAESDDEIVVRGVSATRTRLAA